MDTSHSEGGLAPARITLDLRGQRVTIDREALMELPESVLLVLFPKYVPPPRSRLARSERDPTGSGVVLSPQRPLEDVEGEDADEEDVYFVDVRLSLLHDSLPLVRRRY
jgi:hypothetical protein